MIEFELPRQEGVSSLIFHAQGVSKGSGLQWLAAHHAIAEIAHRVWSL